MLDRLRSEVPKVIWTAERDTMTADANAEQDKARRFRDAALPHLDDVYRAGALSHAQRRGRRRRGAGVLFAGVAPFRQLSRSGNETVALGNIAKRLQRRVRASRPPGSLDGNRRGRCRAGAAAAVAGAAGVAGNRAAAQPGRRDDPPPRRRTAAAVPRSHRAARGQRIVVSGNRRGGRRAGRNGDVAACPRAFDAAFGMERRRKEPTATSGSVP